MDLIGFFDIDVFILRKNIVSMWSDLLCKTSNVDYNMNYMLRCNNSTAK